MRSQVTEDSAPITCIDKTTTFNSASGFMEKQKKYFKFITDDEIGENMEVFHNNKNILEGV